MDIYHYPLEEEDSGISLRYIYCHSILLISMLKDFYVYFEYDKIYFLSHF